MVLQAEKCLIHHPPFLPSRKRKLFRIILWLLSTQNTDCGTRDNFASGPQNFLELAKNVVIPALCEPGMLKAPPLIPLA